MLHAQQPPCVIFGELYSRVVDPVKNGREAIWIFHIFRARVISADVEFVWKPTATGQVIDLVSTTLHFLADQQAKKTFVLRIETL